MSQFNPQAFNPAAFSGSPDGLGRAAIGAEESIVVEASPVRRNLVRAWALLGVAGAAIGAYHGYKRNDSVGWAIGWSLLGSIAPVIVIPVAIAQGFPKNS